MEDLIAAAVVEGGAVDVDLMPNAALALTLPAMDQIEDDEDGIMEAESDPRIRLERYGWHGYPLFRCVNRCRFGYTSLL